MRKTTGTQTFTTFNFVGRDVADYVWTPADQAGGAEYTIDAYADAHRENATDAEYTEAYGQAETFEYAFPGLRVVVLLAGGEVMTVWTIENADATRITKAARREQPVTITYTKADGEETVRTIEPTGLKLTKAGDTLIVAMDRLSGEKRSFRLDRVSAYTVHRTRRTVRTEAPAPSKAELFEAFKASRPAGRPVPASPVQDRQVRHTRHGYTGRTVPGTRKFGPGGFSVIVELDDPTLTPGGTTRASEDELITLTEERQAALARAARMLTATDPESTAGLDAERELDRALGHR